MSGRLDRRTPGDLASPITSEIEELRTAITLDLCSEIEETRARIGGIVSAIGDLILPAYIAAVSLAVIAYQLATR
jgi:hypothetical protein